MKRRRNHNRKSGCLFIVILIVLMIIFIVSKCNKENTILLETSSHYNLSDINTMIEEFAENHNLQTNAWPDKLIELLEKNPETKDFVLNYPLKKDKKFEFDLGEYKTARKFRCLCSGTNVGDIVSMQAI